MGGAEGHFWSPWVKPGAGFGRWAPPPPDPSCRPPEMAHSASGLGASSSGFPSGPLPSSFPAYPAPSPVQQQPMQPVQAPYCGPPAGYPAPMPQLQQPVPMPQTPPSGMQGGFTTAPQYAPQSMPQ